MAGSGVRVDSNGKSEQVTAASGDIPNAGQAPVESAATRLERAVEELESGVARKKRGQDKPPSALEPAYMLVFLAFMVVGLGGMLAYMRDTLTRTRALGPAPDGFMDRVMFDIEAVVTSYPAHFAEYWLLDCGIVVGGLALVLSVRDFRLRRRLFKLLATLTIGAYAALMVMVMLSPDHPLRNL